MIRDTIEQFEISDSTLLLHPNEAGVLNYLYAGLEHLYATVRESESELPELLRELAETNANASVSPAIRACAFHWYATTACNFVKTIGWLRKMQEPDAPTPDDYLERALPSVMLWRNKVSAHFAFHTPHKKDTPADLLASVIPPSMRMNDRYFAGGYTISVKRQGISSTSKLLPWSLTEIHESLRLRYGMKPKDESIASQQHL